MFDRNGGVTRLLSATTYSMERRRSKNYTPIMVVGGPDSVAQLGDALHNNPDAYWCPRCWAFTLDCSYLVSELDDLICATPGLATAGCPLRPAATHPRTAHEQWRCLSTSGSAVRPRFRAGAVATQPNQVVKERIERKFRFVRVRRLS